MKCAILVGLGLLVAPCRGQGQDQYVWLRLTEHRVITNAKYQSVNAETLLVVRGGRVMALDLDELVQIRFMKGSLLLQGVAIGAGSGLATGALAASALKAFGSNGTSLSSTVVAFTVIGGIIGGTVASLEKEGDIIGLEYLDNASKAARILEAAKATSRKER